MVHRPISGFNIHTTSDHSIAYCRYGQLTVAVYSDKEPSEKIWEEFCDMVVESYTALGVPDVILTYARTVRSTAIQRKLLRDRIASVSDHWIKRMALMSSSALTRGALGALQILFKQEFELRPFRSDDFVGATNWLRELTEFDPATVQRALVHMLYLLGMTKELGKSGMSTGEEPRA